MKNNLPPELLAIAKHKQTIIDSHYNKKTASTTISFINAVQCKAATITIVDDLYKFNKNYRKERKQ